MVEGVLRGARGDGGLHWDELFCWTRFSLVSIVVVEGIKSWVWIEDWSRKKVELKTW